MVCPHGQKGDATAHRKLSLVFFNTFDPIQLSPESVMHEKDVPMLCEDTNVMGRIPLIPCYMDGQIYPTVPNGFRKSELGGAIADSRPDNGTGIRLHELNVWLWNYEKSLPRPILVAETNKILQKRMSESRLKGAETKRRRPQESEEPS